MKGTCTFLRPSTTAEARPIPTAFILIWCEAPYPAWTVAPMKSLALVSNTRPERSANELRDSYATVYSTTTPPSVPR